MLKHGFIFSLYLLSTTNSFAQECSPVELENAARIRDLIANICNIPTPEECSSTPEYVRVASYEVQWRVEGDRYKAMCKAKDCDGNYSPYFDRYFPYTDYLASCNDYLNTVNLPPIEITQTSTNNPNSIPRCGSIIYTSSQIVGESIPLVGVPFYLTHFSSNVQGRSGDYTTKFAVASFGA